MNIAQYLDVDKLHDHVESGLVTARVHNSLPLTVYSYGKKAVFDHIWDNVTCKTRGLIVNHITGDIVARPYEKFFSIDQRPELLRMAEREELHGNTPVITEKVNGCLGTYWQYGYNWGIATKGSFHSPHAEWATNWLKEHIKKHGFLDFPEGYTPVFEIICQEIQPHVIKYPNDGLFLLSFVKIETGEELNQKETWDYGIKNILASPLIYHNTTFSEALETDSSGSEGYVATYNIQGQAPLKIKIKFPTFLANRKKFYAEQKSRENLITTEWKLGRYAEIHQKAADIIKEALVYCTERHEFIAHFNKEDNKKYRAICVAMLDTNTKKYQELIQKMVDNEK